MIYKHTLTNLIGAADVQEEQRQQGRRRWAGEEEFQTDASHSESGAGVRVGGEGGGEGGGGEGGGG